MPIASIDWSAVGTVVSAIATVVLVFLTGIYVWLTHKTLRSQTDPLVIVYVSLSSKHPDVLQIVIENIGKSVARDISFEPERRIPHRAWGNKPETARKFEWMETGPLVKGIPALGPSESRRINWGNYFGLKVALTDKPLRITCKFKDITLRSMPPAECILDISSFEGTDPSPINPYHQLAEMLEQLKKDVDRGPKLQ